MAGRNAIDFGGAALLRRVSVRERSSDSRTTATTGRLSCGVVDHTEHWPPRIAHSAPRPQATVAPRRVVNGMTRQGIFIGSGIATAVLLTLGAVALARDSGGSEVDTTATASGTTGSSGAQTSIAIPVEGAAVIRDTLTIAVRAAGQAAAWRQTMLLAQVPGRIARVTAREGERVPSGRVLVAIDPREYQLAVADARARVAAAEAQYRELTLFDDRIEDTGIREERRRAARAKSGLDAAEIALERAQLDLRRASVTAPFEGSVASVKVVPGQYVRAGDELLVVQDIDPVKVEVQVLESEIGYLVPGRRATVSFAAFPDRPFTGRVESINPLVEHATRTAKVSVAVPNPANRILPGMYARVALEARRFADRVLVPRAAVLERDRRTMVFVFEPEESGRSEGLAKWRYVTTGLSNDSLVEVVEHTDTKMVAPGEIVLVNGHYTLVHDARVRLVEDAQASGGRPR